MAPKPFCTFFGGHYSPSLVPFLGPQLPSLHTEINSSFSRRENQSSGDESEKKQETDIGDLITGQVRGIGTDVAIVSAMVFLAQFILSSLMGSLVQFIGS